MSQNMWSNTSTPQYAFMAWCLVKHRDTFTFTFTFTFTLPLPWRWRPWGQLKYCYHTTTLHNGTTQGYSSWSVKLTTHFHLVLRLRMSEAIPQFSTYVFMPWCLVKNGDNFTFTFLHVCNPTLKYMWLLDWCFLVSWSLGINVQKISIICWK
jgi:hypothetical protein